ncbi:MAG: TadE family protein [Actinomycetota bacterium]
MKSSQRIPGHRAPADPLESGTRPPQAVSRRGRVRGEDGAAAVEFAIVATLFFMLVFGIIDFGFAFHSWNNTANAAREGARRGAVESSSSVVIARARAAASTLDPAKLTVSVECQDFLGGAFSVLNCGSNLAEGDIVRVKVDYVYDMITPIGSFVPGLGTTLNLHSQSESRFEG